jgi:GT2 family glycosyltransferase/ubiquinone/menaquinone biosynthesis C-methylase UbiE/glycosyltransferase involved in cell wall biosynthesis
MGELIRREMAAKPLHFSGERLTAAISGQVEIEHYHRYLLAREHCRNLDVLDCASGEGYGAALLAQVARSVVGVEIDHESVEAARAEFPHPNLSFQQGDARALPLPDASVDVAVSFETLEHLFEQEQFLSELRRVLRPGGLLVISTPDRDIYSPFGAPPNPFHRLELTRSEFEDLLHRHFANVAVAGQRAMIGSVIIGAGQDAPARSFERRGDTCIEGSDHLARAMYLFALASNEPLPPLRNSVYVHRSDLDTDPQARFEAEIGRRAAEQATLEAQSAAAGERDAANAQIAEIEHRVVELERRVLEADDRANESQGREENAARVIADLQRKEELLQTQMARVEHSLAEAEAQATYLGQRGVALEQHLANALSRAEQAEQQAVVTEQQLTTELAAHSEVRQRASSLAEHLDRIEGSSIWRASYPARRLGARHPGLAKGLRLGAKLAWWTATLQLRRRYRWWQTHRALRLNPPAADQSTSTGITLSLSGRESPADAPASLSESLPFAGIGLPHSPDPVVSLIISTYGQLEVTLACLRSIAAHPPLTPIEIIVVDDAYPGPEDVSMLRDIPGILLLRNAANLGFLRSCNQAARVAKGRYIHMLNNDTEVRSGTIDALAELLDARPDIGMAGSKLLFPDGRLQEAGGILWADASGWNYGRGESPDRPEFNYLREVDYCSGASIMMRRELFESLGGFDERFAPAYYEDTDLAFRLRAEGHKVVYEPRSVVVHHEGVSHGTDLTSGIKAHQVLNQERMLTRWRETLARENYDSGQHVVRARDRAKTRKLVLVIEHYALEPDRDAGSRSTMGILDSLIAAGWVVKFWPLNRAYSPVYTVAMERRGIEVMDHRWPGSLADWLRENGRDLDHLLVIRPDTAAETLPHILGNTDAVLSFYGVDLHFARVRRQAMLDGNPDLLREADFLERLERRVWRNFDLVIYPSEEEAAVVRKISPGTLVCGIIPFCFEAAPPRSAPVVGRSVLFVAGFAHPPNVDAAAFLMADIVPRLEARIGPVTVTLAGSNPTEQVRRLAGKDVTVTGYVTDEELAALYASHRVSVVPLRFGAGVKGKVVESLSLGLPLVTTSTGAQGIAGLGSVVPVHDDADAIAEHLALLLTDDEAWIRQSHAQTAFAADRFSRAVMQQSVLRAFEAGEAATAEARLANAV